MKSKNRLRTVSIDFAGNGNPMTGDEVNSESLSKLTKKIRKFLSESVHIYEDIGNWWDRTVTPGLYRGDRVCNVVLDGDVVAGISIGKRHAKSSKLCTLKVGDNYRSNGLGTELLTLSTRQLVSSGCKRVHFTVSDQVQAEVGSFFHDFGFDLVDWKKNRYSAGHEELIFSAPARKLSDNLRRFWWEMNKKLLLFSIRPEFAQLMQNGHKSVELRRRFSEKYLDYRAFFYVTAPVREIQFSADIEDICSAAPNDLWTRYSLLCGTDYKTFNQYFRRAELGWAIQLKDFRSLPQPIELEKRDSATCEFRAPQSYCYVPADSQLGTVLNASI